MTEDEPMSIFQMVLYVANHWNEIQDLWAAVIAAFFALVGAVVALASLITPLTKTPKDDAILASVKNWMHQISMTNAKDVKGIGQGEPLPWQTKNQQKKEK